MSRPALIFLQLNEINFQIVRRYVERYHDLPSFARLFEQFRSFETYAETEYSKLEPWIQWVSAHTGRTYADHGVFRLGDIVRTHEDITQVFEALEARGLRVGAISPMNARNRLNRPAYFVPDPWTDTPSDPSGFSRRLTHMLRQTVNENASGRISASSLVTIAEAVVRTFSPGRTWHLLRTIAATRKAPWLKSLVLDQLVHLVHRRLWFRTRPDVSFVFLNAGAHVQHHYLFNSEFSDTKARNPAWYVPGDADPVRDMLRVYDRILSDYLALADSGVRLLVATGLSQVPYDRVKFYYRLRDHGVFLAQAGIRFKRVQPRMTRDFEFDCENEEDAQAAHAALKRVSLARDGLPLFNDVELRGHSVFATLTYPNEILPNDDALLDGRTIAGFGKSVDFVAIKNGMHSTRGYAFVSPNISAASVPPQPVHVASLFGVTMNAAG